MAETEDEGPSLAVSKQPVDIANSSAAEDAPPAPPDAALGKVDADAEDSLIEIDSYGRGVQDSSDKGPLSRRMRVEDMKGDSEMKADPGNVDVDVGDGSEMLNMSCAYGTSECADGCCWNIVGKRAAKPQFGAASHPAG